MNGNYPLAVLVLAGVLASCDMTTGAGQKNPVPPGGSTDSPLPVTSTYYYLGVQQYANAGPFHIRRSSSDCSGPYPYALLNLCVQSVTIDGVPAPEGTPLEDGHLVEIYENWAGGQKIAWIDIRRSVVGPVEAIDAPHGQLTVLGQRVHLVPDTLGDARLSAGIASTGIAIGDRVAVSGHFTADGQVVASRVDHEASPGPLVLRGVLAPGAAGELAIGEMRLDLGTATPYGFPAGAPNVGDAVLVFADEVPQNGLLAVRAIHFAGGNWGDFIPSNVVAITELTGFVTAAASMTEVEVSGYRVPDIICPGCGGGGPNPGPIPTGTRVDVETRSGLNPYATVTLPAVGDPCCTLPRMIGALDGVDPASGTLTMFGKSLQITPATRIVWDESASPTAETFSLDEIVDDVVTVFISGVTDGGPVHVSEIRRKGEGAKIVTDEWNGSLLIEDTGASTPMIWFYGSEISVDVATTVTFCNFNVCSQEDQDFLVNRASNQVYNVNYYAYDFIDWTIDVDTAVAPIRAEKISIHGY